MKVRQGFVSNSSTSSFVVVMKKEHYEKGLEMIHPYSKACIEALGHNSDIFLGEEVVSLGTMSTQGGSQWEWIDVDFDIETLGEDEDADDLKYESLDDLIKAVKKVYGKESILTSSLDC